MLLFFFIFVVMLFNWLSIFTGIVYIALGIFVIIYKFFVIYLDPPVAYALGALLILYGIFRIFRTVDKLKKRNG